MRRNVSGFEWVGIFSCLILLMSTAALGQLTGRIQGQVTDATGAVLPGVEVTVTNEAIGFSRVVITADDGYYRVSDLLPGTYTVSVEMPGFRTSIRSNVEVSAESVLGLNVTLEVGEITESVTVSGETIQVETQVTRISEVLQEDDIRELPMQGRGVLNIVMITPGLVGKQMQQGNYCCDVFSNYGAPRINSGANEQKAVFMLDGIDLRYSEGSGWGMSFSPSPDAIQEVRVTTNPHSAEFGRVSGPQIQIVTKGGTNNFHGTAHYLFNGDQLNARAFFSDSKPDIEYNLFGGTVGGPILKDKLFFFGAYEGLQSTRAGSQRVVVETQAFRDFVVNTRPNTLAANLLQQFPPVKYATQELQDVGSPLPGVFNWDSTPDGIPDLGVITLDDPFKRDGNQYNGRIDFHHPNDKDRIFGTYWFSHPEWGLSRVRTAFIGLTDTAVTSAHFTHTRSWTPTVLSEVRYGLDIIDFTSGAPVRRFPHIPSTGADDGFGIGAHGWSEYDSYVHYAEGVFSINRGKHAFKFGTTYRNSDLHAEWPNVPSYGFASILDFADDEPYSESRRIDTAGGQGTDTDLRMLTGDFSLFVQNTWQIRPNLTLNYGLRWEYFFPVWLDDRDNWQPHLSSDQINPAGVTAGTNTQAANRLYSRDLDNFSPRFGLAWDPSGEGKMSIRFGLGLLNEEINTFNLYGVNSNPPSAAYLSAGFFEEIKDIVYGLAPEGTVDFPLNPAFSRPTLSPAGGIEGARVSVTGFMTDLQSPQVLDTLAGIQYQLRGDTLVQLNYKYRRGTKELYMDDINRFAGDLLDGTLDRLNPNFNRVTMLTNRGRRIGHNIVASLTKRYSQGYSLTASYNYTNARNNFGAIPRGHSDFYQAGSTDAFNLDPEWARDDIPHVFTFHSLWELPFLRDRNDLAGRLLGGWKLGTIANLQAGELFIVSSNAGFGAGGDFNADGQQTGFRGAGGDRPDEPSQSLSSSFSKQEWLRGAIPASAFPIPDPSSPRIGTLARDAFREPGYGNVDLNLIKEFRFPVWGNEDGRLQVRGEFLNLLNRLNIGSVSRFMNSANFAEATSAHPNRVIQLAFKFIF
ncbi:TonB-dependent receptor [Acidobacteria bacterium AH-259-G07]|nr:TonB-dependent receptor [Acidobacteria bacterium AH-259-G07]